MPTSSSSDRLSSLSDDILIRIMSLNPTQDAVRTLKEMIELNFFDTVGSSTAAPLPCSHPICTYGGQSPAAQCSPQVNQCSYTFQYEDGSGTSGAYVSDELYFDMILGQSTPGNVNSSATIVFGCSTSQSGDLTKTDRAGPLSVSTSPITTSLQLNLESIAVNGQLLSINPAVFATSDNQGTIVDCGTTLAYLVQEAYDPLVESL
ncbi:aspartic proteinase [Trifolium repens]|nr:aspartic proteinase [Trifolium repens]